MNSNIRIKSTLINAPFTYAVEINPAVNSFWMYAVPDEAVFHAQRITVAEATMIGLDQEGVLLEMESQFQKQIDLPKLELQGAAIMKAFPLLEVQDARYAAVSPMEKGFFTCFVDNIGAVDQVMIWGNVSFLISDGFLVGIQAKAIN
ncbi:hypothetical protein IHN63_11250 [Deinococcus sp. 6YEL10]|uniref:hypothetical protein n=1 Tax=Deinococcus sp. 6YEL10 TaxID=2745870 RepID=UPI0011AEF98E|nr:hypothetical protein [Deinococcus sp. 6YEL10]MCD0161881.1 hypothetical protein [Deinococcus sp. 6YEL10]